METASTDASAGSAARMPPATAPNRDAAAASTTTRRRWPPSARAPAAARAGTRTPRAARQHPERGEQRARRQHEARHGPHPRADRPPAPAPRPPLQPATQARPPPRARRDDAVDGREARQRDEPEHHAVRRLRGEAGRCGRAPSPAATVRRSPGTSSPGRRRVRPSDAPRASTRRQRGRQDDLDGEVDQAAVPEARSPHASASQLGRARAWASSRARSSAPRRMRETCICETPISSPISCWVRPVAGSAGAARCAHARSGSAAPRRGRPGPRRARSPGRRCPSCPRASRRRRRPPPPARRARWRGAPGGPRAPRGPPRRLSSSRSASSPTEGERPSRVRARSISRSTRWTSSCSPRGGRTDHVRSR